MARLADVSIGTASKALNANGRLRQETRDKVIRVAREIGYRPNDLAQSLHRARSMTVGTIANDSFGRFTLPTVEALENTSPTAASPSSCLRTTIQRANASTWTSCSASASTASSLPRSTDCVRPSTSQTAPGALRL